MITAGPGGKRTRNHAKGRTLLEGLLAVVLFAIGLLAILRLAQMRLPSLRLLVLVHREQQVQLALQVFKVLRV